LTVLQNQPPDEDIIEDLALPVHADTDVVAFENIGIVPAGKL